MAGLIRAAARYWALLGGSVLLAVLALTAASVTLDLLHDRPIPGEFELVQLGAAVAAFAFLPWCQIRRGHVTVDFLVRRAGLRIQRIATAAGSMLMLLFALLLLWRMSLGLLSYYDPVYPETTPILGIPIWTVFPPILISCCLWAASCIASLAEDLEEHGANT